MIKILAYTDGMINRDFAKKRKKYATQASREGPPASGRVLRRANFATDDRNYRALPCPEVAAKAGNSSLGG